MPCQAVILPTGSHTRHFGFFQIILKSEILLPFPFSGSLLKQSSVADHSERTTIIIYNNSNSLPSACQINYVLIILSVKTLHTLVFFCKFPDLVAFREISQPINKTINNDKVIDLLCKRPNSSRLLL